MVLVAISILFAILVDKFRFFFCIFRFFLTSIQILCQIKVAGLQLHPFIPVVSRHGLQWSLLLKLVALMFHIDDIVPDIQNSNGSGTFNHHLGMNSLCSQTEI